MASFSLGVGLHTVGYEQLLVDDILEQLQILEQPGLSIAERPKILEIASRPYPLLRYPLRPCSAAAREYFAIDSIKLGERRPDDC